jgi:poly(hydroxyalkanoate) depolymerase family esterase
MFDFGKAAGSLGKWEKFRGLTATLQSRPLPGSTPLTETRDLEPNPGNLRMFSYVPASTADNQALVVVLHGCGQTAAGYDHGAGWSTLADRFGFALLLPEQQRANNPGGCFNWFEPGDTQRDHGEAASIRAMVAKMVRENKIDPRRVFVTGLSAGGAMTSAMLACYPEVFAAGAIIAGLPYGAAGNTQEAFASMFQSPARPAREWGDLVRRAAPHHNGPWPRVSVWHGNADKTVIPSNARETLKQWIDVHGVSEAPSLETVVEGYPRQVWRNEAGEDLIESYSITHMAHGTPLATGDADFECGAAGPFLLDAGISSSFHIAGFFGLTKASARSVSSTKKDVAAIAARLPAGRSVDTAQPQILHGEVMNGAKERRSAKPLPPRINIGAVINKALEAAGLLRR